VNPSSRSIPETARLSMVGLVSPARACRSSDAGEPIPSRLGQHRLNHDGIVHSCWITDPVEGGSSGPKPVVLALHRSGGRAAGICRGRGWQLALSEQWQFILIFPQGVHWHWNDGRRITLWRAQAGDIDDVGLQARLIEDVASRYPADRGPVFATRISNRGRLSCRPACERSALVRAISPVVASVSHPLACAPDWPASILILMGTRDPRVPHDGGQSGFGRRDLGRALPTGRVRGLWAELNDRGQPPTASDTRIDAWTTAPASMVSHSECEVGSQVVLVRIEGGAHAWPGDSLNLTARLIGNVSLDFNTVR